ncbi:MAG TPA: hypothetical protein VJX70_05405 [Candidatus Acidoferrum sp.]|nr:hypothetical protein [Candidatus Acidoferrum sp.]
MKARVVTSRYVGFCGVAVGIFLGIGVSVAAGQDKPAASIASAGSQKPQPAVASVITNDTISAQVFPRTGNTPPAPAAHSDGASQKEARSSETDAAVKAGEIASLQKELKAKQKRVELLMHLFVTDERRFVQFPTDPIDDPAAKARIRAEQEELRAESAACARLQRRIDALNSTTSTTTSSSSLTQP